jgi:hypothetical protein
MKKIILTAAISTALIASSVYAAGPATSGVVFSGEGSYSTIASTTKVSVGGVSAESAASTGFGLGGYVGYDYAITGHVTIGGKTGYFHSFGLGKYTAPGQEDKFTSDNIPILANAKYYFNSGLYLGGETGVNFQKVSGKQSGSAVQSHSDSSNWNPQYVIGGLVGYQINEQLSIDGSMDYMTGKDIFNIDSSEQANSKNDPIANIKFGIAVNYKLPM